MSLRLPKSRGNFGTDQITAAGEPETFKYVEVYVESCIRSFVRCIKNSAE